MNKLILAFLLGISFTSLFAFRSSLFVPKKSTAEVEKIEEFYVFTDSKPVMPFDSLGIVDAGFITGTEYETIRASLLRRARKKIP